MAIEVQNTTVYAYSAPANDPDNAIFVQDVSGYVVEGSPVDGTMAVFEQYGVAYELMGGVTDRAVVYGTRLYELTGLQFSSLTGPAIVSTKTYEITGGQGQFARLRTPYTKFYMITD